jgi:energy-coupling factor transport system permease protein
MLHPLTWLVWLGTCSVALWQTRNPLYVLLIGLVVLLVRTVLQRLPQHAAPSPLALSPVRLGLLIIPTSALFNALWTRAGDTVLLALPAQLPLIGGNITLEAVVFGALNGLVLATLISIFSLLNLALSVRDLIGLVPRAFHPLAVIVSIAITYVPFTLRQAQAIKEAQAVRGHTVRGLRDWLPLFMPLLTGGLERALALAEAMTARGFATSRATTPVAIRPLVWQWLTLLGLLLVCSGWLVRLLLRWPTLGLWVGLMGLALMLFSVWALGRSAPRSTHRVQRWSLADAVVIATALAALAFVLFQPWLSAAHASLVYYPYPLLTWPQFDPWLGGAFMLLAAPAGVLLAKPNFT